LEIDMRVKEALLPDANINTYYDPPPIGIRSFDWAAIDLATYGGEPTDPIGWGATEQEAIDELVWRLLELKDENK
jgi:hypothetical protein